MLMVTISCLPKLDEPKLKELFEKLVRAAVSHESAHVKDERDILVRFLPDSMAYGLGTDILLEVSFFHANGRFIYDPEKKVALVFRDVLQTDFPEAKIYTRLPASDSAADIWPEDEWF